MLLILLMQKQVTIDSDLLVHSNMLPLCNKAHSSSFLSLQPADGMTNAITIQLFLDFLSKIVIFELRSKSWHFYSVFIMLSNICM